ncbi:acyl-CoA thioesterase [Mycolicibacterium moriokaense]|nr:acyl-CoA thioesterase [Mycolicibacterium moriokaense]
MRSTLNDDRTGHELPVSARDPLSHTMIHRYRVATSDLGAAGFVDGATVLTWIHRAARAVAARWSGQCCVAASLGNFHLDNPIGVGELVEVHACLVHTGSSSIHVLVTVTAGAAGHGTPQTTQCPMVFVAVDDLGNPVRVASWTPVTMLELQRQRQARVRIRTRRRIEDAIASQSLTPAGASSRTTRRVVVTRADAGGDGAVHGDRVMRWIDDAANACAADRSGVGGLTSYVASIRFRSGLAVGDHVTVTARVVHTGPRSTHLDVRVTRADVCTGTAHVVAEGLLVVVSLDASGRARSVRQWTPDCDDDRRLDRQARQLIEMRQLFEPYSRPAVSWSA